jgi:AraC-like DNA-binding protein
MERRETIDAVLQMQDYIERHICEPITLYELSRCAGYSPAHCARVFKELTGKSPFDYIRKLRLSRAALKLRADKVKVIDVALEFVFDSHEGFTRAFSKEFGITPHQYRKHPPPVYLFIPYRIRDSYSFPQTGDTMEKRSTPTTVFVQVIDRPDRKLILKRGKSAEDYWAYCEEAGCDVWGLLCSLKEALYEPIGMWLPDALRSPGTSKYAQGVEVPTGYAGIIPDGFETIDLAACKMMVFQGQPYDDERFGEAIADVWDVMKTYNPELYGFQWADEDAPRFQLEPQGYRGYIEARPVRELSKKRPH